MIISKIIFFLLSKIKKFFYSFIYRKRLKISINVDFDYASKIIIKGNGKILIAENSHIRSKKYGYHSGMPFPTTLFADGDNSSIHIGANSRLNGCYIHSKEHISIGKNCAIASGVNIIDSNGHKTISKNRTLEIDIPKKIIIKDNVWIGLNAVLLKDTIIGENSIIGANSVVKGEFPANSLIIGNPGVLVKTLNI
jgi:acetyltransferase-like isoleucine patch superfamily enzyme